MWALLWTPPPERRLLLLLLLLLSVAPAQASCCRDVQLNKKSCGAALMLPPTEEGRLWRGPGYCSNENKDECISNNGPAELHRPPSQHRSPSPPPKKIRVTKFGYISDYAARRRGTKHAARASTTAQSELNHGLHAHTNDVSWEHARALSKNTEMCGGFFFCG